MFLFIVVTDLLYTIKKDKKYTEFSAADCDLPQTFLRVLQVNPKVRTNPTSVAEPKGYACIPYVKGISERVNRILTGANIRTAYKPLTTLGGILKKNERQTIRNSSQRHCLQIQV